MKHLIKSLIKEELNKILTEADPGSPSDSPGGDSGDLTAADLGADPGMPTDSSGAGSGGVGGGAPDLGGGDLGGDPMAGGGDVGGMGGGIESMGQGFGGGGGGLETGSDSSGGGPEGGSGGSDNIQEPTQPDENIPPNEQVKEIAKSIAEKTNDVQKTLKSVKHMIQLRYNNIQDASDVILDLYSDPNPVVQNVARRLALFILGR